MAITVQCPWCQTSHDLADEFAGRSVACPRCNIAVLVPSNGPTAATGNSPTAHGLIANGPSSNSLSSAALPRLALSQPMASSSAGNSNGGGEGLGSGLRFQGIYSRPAFASAAPAAHDSSPAALPPPLAPRSLTTSTSALGSPTASTYEPASSPLRLGNARMNQRPAWQRPDLLDRSFSARQLSPLERLSVWLLSFALLAVIGMTIYFVVAGPAAPTSGSSGFGSGGIGSPSQPSNRTIIVPQPSPYVPPPSPYVPPAPRYTPPSPYVPPSPHRFNPQPPRFSPQPPRPMPGPRFGPGGS